MRSLFEFANIPGEIQIIIFTLAIILIVGSFTSGIDLGILKIPEIPRTRRRTSLGAGIVLFGASIGASQPLIGPPEEPPVTPAPYGADKDQRPAQSEPRTENESQLPAQSEVVTEYKDQTPAEVEPLTVNEGQPPIQDEPLTGNEDRSVSRDTAELANLNGLRPGQATTVCTEEPFLFNAYPDSQKKPMQEIVVKIPERASGTYPVKQVIKISDDCRLSLLRTRRDNLSAEEYNVIVADFEYR